MKPIVVAGSINIDLVVNVQRLPVPGETVSGAEFHTHPGGKGANQAGAAARLGHPVHMIGRVGCDAFGAELRAHLKNAGVNTEAVVETEGASGVALIAVAPHGENNIIVAPGANALLSPEDIELNRALIRSAAVVLTQLEIPLETVEALAAICRKERVPLVLDPAPARALPAELLSRVAWITPNEVEAQQLAGRSRSARGNELRQLAEHLMALGPDNVILKLGERGSYLATMDGLRAAVPSCIVQAADTTGAGDAFNGAFAVALARGSAPLEAAQFASVVAALSVTRHGALPSMPTQAEVDAFLEDRAQKEFA